MLLRKLKNFKEALRSDQTGADQKGFACAAGCHGSWPLQGLESEDDMLLRELETLGKHSNQIKPVLIRRALLVRQGVMAHGPCEAFNRKIICSCAN
jgi:hypothetical protein